MSPCFDNLLHSPRFLRLARVALRSAIQAQPVVLFADDPLATAAAADPEVMRRVAPTVLAPLTRSRHRTDDIAQHARDLA
jgi:predicted ABC-type transport system involved in lysophospholipase L1 biosynthesis ATPase subunit